MHLRLLHVIVYTYMHVVATGLCMHAPESNSLQTLANQEHIVLMCSWLT